MSNQMKKQFGKYLPSEQMFPGKALLLSISLLIVRKVLRLKLFRQYQLDPYLFAFSEDHIVQKAKLLKKESIKQSLFTAYSDDFDIEKVKMKIAALEQSGSTKYFTALELLTLTDDMFKNTITDGYIPKAST